ncbi:MAG: hypothetical protein IKD04_04075 [Clostridia bacterium]|nr:hypothetical protein [Clostridia bacterium]
MKKVLALLLTTLLALTFTACKGDKNTSSGDTVDLEYFSKLGQIPECEYSLGESVTKIKDELSAKLESQDENSDFYYEVTEGENNTLIDNGAFMYYYQNEKEENGISFIASYSEAYGFAVGDIIIEVEKAIESINYKKTELTEKNTFFMYGASEGTAIICEFEENNIMFVFVDNALCATAIYNNNDWDLD